MLDLTKEWNISFAGCGFMGVYYVGACCCILERFPRLIQDASKICGASAGAVMAAIISVGLPIEKCCADLIFMAKEGRKRKLGPLHPAFNLLRIVRDSLMEGLPEDAHVRASGKLCVSLTRVSDGKNELVTKFDSKEELVQALLCSCFVPFYCGVIPPTYRGVHYVDGAISDNQPQCYTKNTITFSAYAGESDLCPRDSMLIFHEVRFNNVSIQVNSENVHRLTSTFFPPPPEAMAEICHKGYMDALRFLQDNHLISTDSPMKSLETNCCECKVKERAEESNENAQQNGLKPHQKGHWWLDPQLIENLPVAIKKVFCEACRKAHTTDAGLLSQMTEYLPKKVTSYLQMPCARPVDSAFSLAQRLVDWIPDVHREMSWLYGMAGEMCKNAWKDKDSESSRLPLSLNQRKDTKNLPMASETTLPSSLTLTWNTQEELDHMPLTPPLTPIVGPTSGFGEAATESPKSAGTGWGLGRAVGWIRNITSEQTSDIKKTDSVSFSAFK
ncbi:patatin-like phospholipase domain-containing protein 2 [Perca fluviatilis]|uniref:patatin-like phospholipase domain-containing protein 2 n=1 Tax=Perca fluviatilis TaxID=8168 RepID=UPI0019626EB1|nr:patatin-like phospholipase domain-containing protein 2 [Perca fluviatilis]